MGHLTNQDIKRAAIPALLIALAFSLLAAAPAQAVPFHARKASLDVSGLNHACGAAVDSKGDFYASSAGESKIKVFNPSHVLLTSIEDTHEPCGLAVDIGGDLLVSERGTGNVVLFRPNAYPFSGPPTYGSAVPIDTSGKAKGIAVDRFDNRLYIAEGDHVAVDRLELQEVEVRYATGGTYKLKFQGGAEETAPIAFDATNAQVQAALEGLFTIGAGNVSVSGSNGTYSVAFVGTLAFTTDVPQIEVVSSLTGDETQTVTVDATVGTYTLKFKKEETALKFKEEETAAIAFNAPASKGEGAGSVEAALEGLGEIAPGDVSVSGGPGNSGGTNPYFVRFKGAYANTDVSQMSSDVSGLTGGSAAVATTTPGGSASVLASTVTSGGPGANIGEGTLTEATGVAAFSYLNALPAKSNSQTEHFLWVADANGADHLDLFRSQNAGVPTLSRELSGANTPDHSFGFGATGASLAEDPGNRDVRGKCLLAEGELERVQACTAGHLFLYDKAHKALDEFDASGEYLDQARNAAFADAEPSAIAIDRSGGANDGTLYVTAGPGAGAKALAFGPLKAPERKALKLVSEGGLSQKLSSAQSVAVDSRGDVYVATGSAIHIYSPSGTEIKTPAPANKPPIKDEHKPANVAVDSTGTVYVVDQNGTLEGEETEVTSYTPNEYPPKSSTTYTRRTEPIIKVSQCPAGKKIIRTIAVNPGPGAGKDHLFIVCDDVIRLYDSAANGSTLINEEFGKGLMRGVFPESIAVNGTTGTVYVGENPHVITAIDEATGKFVTRFEDTGFTSGAFGANPQLGLDQSSGHLVEFDERNHSAREYDAAGGFVAEFGNFTEGLTELAGVAVDNACALHEPEPLTGQACKEYDPANGTAYVAFADTHTQLPSPSPPYKGVNAFGPLSYDSTPAKHKVTVSKSGNGSGTVTSTPAGIDCGTTCEAEFLETEVVTLEAQAAPLSKFTGWSGCEAEPSPTKCEVTPSTDRVVSAHFEHEAGTEFPLEVVFEGPGSGEVSSTPDGIQCSSTCSAEFPEATVVTLEASAPQGSEFLSWTGCEAEPSPEECKVTMSGAKEVKVKFGIEHPKLTVAKEGNGEGTVTSSPAGIDCGATCTHKFDLDEEVTLSAEADPGSVFAGWEGCEAEPSASECEVKMSEAIEVTATFLALPGVLAEPAVPVLYDEATLHGEVDPAGLLTEYRFEYLSGPEYEANGESFKGAQATPTRELAPGSGFVAVQEPIAALEEGTEYRFRLRAVSSAGLAEDEGSFETLQRRAPSACANDAYRFGLSANLPDCRAYELATPGQTDGLTPFAASYGGSPSRGLNDWLTVQRGEGAGELLTYFTDGTLPGFEGNGVQDGYRAQRGSGDHPAEGWQSALFSPNYRESAPSFVAGPRNAHQLGVSPDQLYSVWETDVEGETFPETLPSGTYLRTPAGFEALGRGSLGTDLKAIRDYLSAGGAHAIFSSKEHLEAKAAPSGTVAIYDRAAGQSSSEVVSVKPDGSAFGGGENASYLGASEDGTSVAFSVGGTLYLHRDGETFAIGPSSGFAGISADGKRVFYGSLGVCDTETGPCAGAGSHAPTQIAASGIFALVSPDGSHAFFSSTEVLSGEESENGEEAEVGKHNLYAWDGSATRFIGRLPAQDFEAFAGIGMSLGAWTRAIGPGEQSARAEAPTRSTPSGNVFVFQSHAQLSGYDNEGAGEIYRYEPAAAEGQRLICLSCDPSGAPPSADALLEDIGAVSNVPVQAETMIANLTDNGQAVFFQSFDRLLPEDANETEDVYEWETKGTEGCARAGGCLALISSGQGETPSFLYAMSADGHDVFFQTKEKLLGLDVAGSPSIYDARVGGGIPEPSPPAPCQGDACQGVGTLPPALPNPASSGGGEAGGEPSSPPVSSCAKGKHRVKGRCVAGKHKRHAKKHRGANTKRGGKR